MENKQIYNDYLMHHGIKGQKWGVRRYQNPDGTLTDAGKKRIKQEYVKYAKEHQDYYYKTDNNRILRAYNNAADRMNNGLVDKYNDDYDKKLGSKKAKDHDYENDSEYNKGMTELLNKVWSEEYMKLAYQDTVNSPAYLKGKVLAEKYKMYEWDDMAASNFKTEEEWTKKYGH